MNIILPHSALTGTGIRHAFLLIGLVLISACAKNGGVVQLPSENYNSRVRMVVIHHTSENFEDSVNILTRPSSNSVSSHYLIPEPSDETYTGNKLEVFELVPETQRAWHAGRSYWAEKSGLNDQSIGIELVNQTYCKRDEDEDASFESAEWFTRLCFYPDFAESQIVVLVKLLRGIYERHPGIDPTNIVGHSDIAPSRKIDPGPRFPWQRLYQLGFGAWFDDETVSHYWERFSTRPVPLVNLQKALHAYGYQIEATGVLDIQTRKVLRAFQMHFRPSGVTGEPNIESTAILYALIDKYRPKELQELLIIDCGQQAKSNPLATE